MKRISFGLFFAILGMLLINTSYAGEIIVNPQNDVSSDVILDESSIPAQNPPAYKKINADKFDVKLNNPNYIKDITTTKNKNGKIDFQLKRPSISPYQPYQD